MNGPWVCKNCNDKWGHTLSKEEPIKALCHLCAGANPMILGKNVIWGQCDECGNVSMADVEISDRDGEDRTAKVCWKCGYSNYETNTFAEEFEI